jgi:hypothetical protein
VQFLQQNTKTPNAFLHQTHFYTKRIDTPIRVNTIRYKKAVSPDHSLLLAKKTDYVQLTLL